MVLNFGFILNVRRHAAESLLGTALHLEDRFYDGIVKDGAHLLDGLIRAIGPSAVGQQRDRELAVGIDPQRRAGIAEMAVGSGAEIFSGLRG